MPSEQPEPVPQSARIRAGVGVGLILAGAIAYALRMDRPKYEITATQPTIRLSLDDLPEDAARQHVVSVQVKNTGRYAIRIAGVKPSCWCTVAETIPGDPIEPGSVETIRLSATLPRHGSREAEVAIHTTPATDPAIVHLVMHGRTVRTPYVRRMAGPIQLRTKHPNEHIVEVLEVETDESIGSENWLTKLTANVNGPRIELVDVSDVETNEAAGTVIRQYRFRLDVVGPDTTDAPLAFSLIPHGTSESQSAMKPCAVRVVLRPTVRVSPQRLQVVLEDGRAFPKERDIWVESSEDSQLPAIADVRSDAAWIRPRSISDATQNVSRQIRLTLDAPPEPRESSLGEVVITLDDADFSSLVVPVRLVNHRSK